MAIMNGRVTKITKRGYLFLDPQDGGLDVFVSDKIAEKSGDKFAIGDRVSFDEKLSSDGRRFAASIKLVERPALLARNGIIRNHYDDRTFCFLRDELTGDDIFVSASVIRECGVRLTDGDVVIYTLMPDAPRNGRCAAAVSVRLK
jgi:cold shock CspA family protein